MNTFAKGKKAIKSQDTKKNPIKEYATDNKKNVASNRTQGGKYHKVKLYSHTNKFFCSFVGRK